MTRLQRAVVTAIPSALLQVIVIPLATSAGAAANTCAVLAIPALFGQIAYDGAFGAHDGGAHPAGAAAYLAGFIAWFILFWFVVGSLDTLVTQVRRGQRPPDEPEDPPAP
jgi:hypothetical protein